MSAAGPGTQTAERSITAVLLAAGLFVIPGLALGLYQSFYFKFSNFYAFQPVYVGLVFALFHIAYFTLAVPAALFHRQFGYKLGALLGLSSFALSAFLLYLAVVQRSSGFFAAAVAMMGSSGVLLDTSLNPLAIEVGNPSTSVVRFNIFHAFNGLGLFGGYFMASVLFEKDFLLTLGSATPQSARPYILIGLAVMLLAFLVEQIPILPLFGRDKTSAPQREIAYLLGDKSFLMTAATLCACCAALMILWSANYKYHLNEMPGHALAVFERGWFWFFFGRIAGCTLMRWIDPMRLLLWSTGLCLIAVAIAAAVGGEAGWASLLSASAFFSILYPTILGSALDRHRAHIKLAAGLLLAAAGIGSALSAWSVNLALDVLLVNPRVVLCCALPFLGLVLAYGWTTSVPASRTSKQPVASP
jgi:FHS family L-fucose permease-like MFS transporter